MPPNRAPPSPAEAAETLPGERSGPLVAYGLHRHDSLKPNGDLRPEAPLAGRTLAQGPSCRCPERGQP